MQQGLSPASPSTPSTVSRHLRPLLGASVGGAAIAMCIFGLAVLTGHSVSQVGTYVVGAEVLYWGIVVAVVACILLFDDN